MYMPFLKKKKPGQPKPLLTCSPADLPTPREDRVAVVDIVWPKTLAARSAHLYAMQISD